MLISEAYVRLADFIVTVIDDVNVTVIYANQTATRPKKPFVTLSVNSIEDVSFPLKFDIDNTGKQELVLNKRLMVTIDAYCDILHTAEDLLTKVQNYLRTDLAYYHFKSELVYNQTIAGVNVITIALDGVNENRAMLELEFMTTQILLDEVGLIDNITITDENTGNELTINR